MIKFTKKLAVIIGACVIALGGIVTLVIVLHTPRESILKIYNWEDFIDTDLLTKFEKHYREVSGDKKFRIKYDTFTDNEELLTKIEVQSRDYDLAFPSDYMVEKLYNKGLLNPIDAAKIPNYNTENLSDVILSRSEDFSVFDGKLYAVPYDYGTLGIMYDKSIMSEDDITAMEAAGWAALWGGENGELSKYSGKITMKKSARDTIGTAMLYAYRDQLTSANIADILNIKGDFTLDAAKTALNAQITAMHPTYENDEGKQSFANPDNKDFAFGLYWNCDAGLIMGENENIGFYVPTEGTNLWFDSFVMPKYGKNSDAAHAFINFMLDYENAKPNMEYVGTACAVTRVVDELREEWEDDGTIFPNPETLDAAAVMQNFDDTREKQINDLMIEIMSHAAQMGENGEGGNLLWLWLTLGVIAAAAAGCGVYYFIRRRRRAV
jgi:spermidine/putrescine transport system substrate-binding protein